MIRYPSRPIKTIGITAPSSGVAPELHSLLEQTIDRQREKGFLVEVGATAWTQKDAKSASAETRSKELMQMLEDPLIDVVIPPWGGELLIEILEYLNFSEWQPKWILGYSDISLLLLAVTLNTGIATAHGTNSIDIRGTETDATTGKWLEVLRTKKGGMVSQTSSSLYQKTWEHDQPTPLVFHLTEKTVWKSVSKDTSHFNGRLLGGCIDVIHHLIGTPYGNLETFEKTYISGEPIVWFLENCEMSVTDLKRSLTQMKYAGWFENCAGILFGRSEANHTVGSYTIEKLYSDLEKELGVPIIYDIDCGHMPPQITFVNGAWAEIDYADGAGRITQKFI